MLGNKTKCARPKCARCATGCERWWFASEVRPADHEITRARWVLTWKPDAEGPRAKARLVALAASVGTIFDTAQSLRCLVSFLRGFRLKVLLVIARKLGALMIANTLMTKNFIQRDTIVFYQRLINYLTNWQYADTDA